MPRLRFLLLPLVVAACNNAPPEVEIVETAGACADVFGGQTCTWSRSQGDSLLEVGATVPMAAIAGAPDSMPMAWPPAYQADLAMPTGSEAASGIVNYTFAWEPTGHPPPTFFAPHFDFHFNFIPVSERQAIDCTDRTKPATLPAGYTLVDEPLPPPVAAMIGVDTLIGTCVPNMGMHALLETEYAATEPFSGAMVIGYYGGRPIFVEPMITRAKLMERQSFELAIPEIPGATNPYPRSFRAEWVPDTESYRMTFSDFRSGS